MILELCEKGQLRDWLLQQQNGTTDDTIEQLCRIIYGISRGMCHLETKQVIWQPTDIFVKSNFFNLRNYMFSCSLLRTLFFTAQ